MTSKLLQSFDASSTLARASRSSTYKTRKSFEKKRVVPSKLGGGEGVLVLQIKLKEFGGG